MSVHGLQKIVGKKITAALFHTRRRRELFERIILGFDDGTHFEIYSSGGELATSKATYSASLEEIEEKLAGHGEDITVFR